MRRLIYSMGVSLDGFIAARDGDIGWGAPDEELHRFHNEQTREIIAHLCGRRLYQVMLSWETTDEAEFGPVELEFARIWKAIPKVVFSTTLARVEGNARLASDDLAAEVARLKNQLGGRGVGRRRRYGRRGYQAWPGRRIPASCQPGRAGRRHPYFPSLDSRINLELIETRTFGSRVVYLRYRRA